MKAEKKKASQADFTPIVEDLELRKKYAENLPFKFDSVFVSKSAPRLLCRFWTTSPVEDDEIKIAEGEIEIGLIPLPGDHFLLPEPEEGVFPLFQACKVVDRCLVFSGTKFSSEKRPHMDITVIKSL